MEPIWGFFENMNELVYVADVDTYEFIYMNKKALSICGLTSLEQTRGKKCYEVLQNASAPCEICNNRELVPGQFKEWRYYNPVYNRHTLVKDTLIELDGKRLRIEIAIDISADTKQNEIIRDYQNKEALINEALRTAMLASDPDTSLKIAIEYLGKALGGERVYIFEKNAQGGDDNTYEWVANGVSPQKDNLQNVPPEVCGGWYRAFADDKCVVIDDTEDVKTKNPLQYEMLKQQDISSITVVPLYEDGRVIGFYGVDNPPAESLHYISNMLQIMGHFMESLLKMRNLVKNLERMSYLDQLTQIGNRYAMVKYTEGMRPGESVGIVYGDITGLKRVNDAEGHEAGDHLILAASACMREAFGDAYELFRIGGDELLAICAGIGETEFRERVARLRKIMADSSVNMAVGADWEKDSEAGVSVVLAAAETQMYKDKAAYYQRTGIDRRR
ncbi:MAG: diguanylate cyclase [Lachnospiraceae bacterium]|nr:diguanylate cyclase [Lachnospiraceae bacterium]